MKCTTILGLSMTLALTAPASAQNVWFNPANGHFYKFTDQPSSYGIAAPNAVLAGGHLAVIDDAAEKDWIVTTIGPSVPYSGTLRLLWIGLDDTVLEGTFVWVNGAPLAYTNWAPGEPNNGGQFGEDAAIMSFPSGLWNDVSVAPPQLGLIEMDVPPFFVDPATGRRYQFTPGFADLAGARAMAANEVGSLVAISNAAEQAFLESTLGPWISRLGSGAWIGLSDEITEGTFLWDSGEPVTYGNWAGGEPNNAGNEDAVEMAAATYRWNDVPVNGLRVGVIETAPGPRLSVTAPAGPGSLRVATMTDTPGNTAVTIYTLNTAGFGSGWFYGINPSILDVVLEYSAGAPPFVNLLDVHGDAAYLIPGGVPAGITFAVVSVVLGGSNLPVGATPPVLHTTL